MKIVVAVIVYDRFYNLVEWIRNWGSCSQQGAELVVIHNYANEGDRQSYQEFCNETGTRYIPRTNIGFDIGAFQDVSRNRLEGFPEFDLLLWCPDDNLPMRKDFIYQYAQKMTPNVGVVAMEVSKSVRRHIRTTGFMVTREVCNRLQFVADPITTKEQCYHFEHRGGHQTFLDQVTRMGLVTRQLSDISVACFWDSGFKRYKNREKEHYMIFPKEAQSTGKVAFICPVYNSYPEIISSLINQTHKNWILYLIHDGENSTGLRKLIEHINDPRIIYTETAERVSKWGHPLRQEYLNKLKNSDFDYVVITNADNFHAPTYCEYMLRGFTNGQVATFCSEMTHSYVAWGVIKCRLQQGFLDCAGVMIRKDVACSVGWQNVEAHSADWLFFNDIITKYGADKFAMVPGNLLVHN